MLSRERALTALGHEQPDRPPVFATYTPEIARALEAAYGRPGEDLGAVMGNDLVKATVGVEMSYHMKEQDQYVCPFGIHWRTARYPTGAYTEIERGPLEDDPDGEKLSAYRLPDPDAPAWYECVRRAIEQYGKEKMIIGSCQCSIFELAWYLHGMEDTLCDMLADPDYANALFDKVMEFPMKAAGNMAEMGVDMVWLGDDVATQRGMMFSVELWRKYFKGRYAAVFAEIRRRRSDVWIAYHSCGNCEQILDDMVEIGLDVLNPIQPLAMDPARIKRRYGKRLTLFGGIDVQKLLPTGTPEQVRRQVAWAKQALGEGGGYILAPAHHIQADTSVENISAFYQEALR